MLIKSDGLGIFLAVFIDKYSYICVLNNFKHHEVSKSNITKISIIILDTSVPCTIRIIPVYNLEGSLLNTNDDQI